MFFKDKYVDIVECFNYFLFMIVDIDSYCEGAVRLTDLDDAIIGIVEDFNSGPKLLYSKPKIIQILCERDLMTEGEAEEYFDYNILGLYAGEQNPVFLNMSLVPKEKDGEVVFELVD